MAKKDQEPYISASTHLPEITPKSVVLAIFLSMLLAGANAYLGLFAGMTVSASIPAAVISMAVLKLFRKHNILENNAVQTAASAGESLAAGVIFTFPALVLMGYWTEFNYWETTLIATCGGVLGVMFTIPLRSALIVDLKLKFPEGLATAEVLKSGDEGGKSVWFLATSALVGAGVKFAEAGLKIWTGILDQAALLGGKTYAYFGMNLSPALLAVGYIVGLNVAVLMFIGGVISWWIAIPLYIAINGAPDMDPVSMGYMLWSTKIRYLGVGAMVVGGLWALLSLRKTVGTAVRQGIQAIRSGKEERAKKIIRTEQDTPMSWVIKGVGFMVVPIFVIYLREIEQVPISGFMAVLMIIAGFLFSTVAGYMAGLVGSSNNPISGVTIATILSSALLLAVFIGTDSAKGPAAAILIGAVVCCAAAIAGDNMQDLKAGHILGATPRKQQIMQMVGVVAGAAVIAPVLDLLLTAYGFGPKTEMNPDSLAAPQATLMQSVAEGVFGGKLPVTMIIIGGFIAVLTILFDLYLEKRKSNFRTPVLAVAIGIYLPFELDSAVMLGGVLAYLVGLYQKQHKKEDNTHHQRALRSSNRAGLLIASGLITGEALVGILLAIPVAISGRSDVLAITKEPLGSTLGVLVIYVVCIWLVAQAKKAYRTTK